MKKQLILSLALFVSILSFAQKKELKTLEKAIKNNNFAEAKATAIQLESMLDSMDDKMKSKFYFNRAKALYANGAGSFTNFYTAFNDLTKVDSKYVSELNDTKQFVRNELLQKANNFYKINFLILGFNFKAMLHNRNRFVNKIYSSFYWTC